MAKKEKQTAKDSLIDAAKSFGEKMGETLFRVPLSLSLAEKGGGSKKMPGGGGGGGGGGGKDDGWKRAFQKEKKKPSGKTQLAPKEREKGDEVASKRHAVRPSPPSWSLGS